MEIIKKDGLRILQADGGKHIREIDDIYEPEHIDKDTGELVPEHFPYYTEMIFLGEQVKEENIINMYVEEEIEEY